MHFQIFPVAEASINTLMNSIDRVIINPLILFLFACALVFFIYGVAKYILSPGNEEVRKTSKSHMLWGIIGMFIMISSLMLMRLIINTLNVSTVQVNTKGEITVQKIPVGK